MMENTLLESGASVRGTSSVAFADRVERVRPSAIRELLKLGDDPEVISFGGGYPDASLFPMDDLRDVYAELLQDGRNSSLQYSASAGLPRLREQVAARMEQDGVVCGPDDVQIIQGGQQGLDLAAKLVLNKGDVVITEDPTFLGALIAFNPYEPTYAAVRTDADGMDPDHLEQVLAQQPRAKLLYVIPDFQNPTGATLSLERRHRIIELANRYGLLVLEDTPYRFLRYEGSHLPTLKSLDTEGRVLHLGSFSKILAPGVRLGWAVASGEILSKFGLLKLAADTQCSTLNMAATSAYLDRYDIDAHIASMCTTYERKRDLTLETLSRVCPDSVTFTRPHGGLFTWFTFPDRFDAAAFMANQLLPKDKVAFVPGATFYAVREEPHHARLSFSGVPDDRLVDGLTRLGRRLNAALDEPSRTLAG